MEWSTLDGVEHRGSRPAVRRPSEHGAQRRAHGGEIGSGAAPRGATPIGARRAAPRARGRNREWSRAPRCDAHRSTARSAAPTGAKKGGNPPPACRRQAKNGPKRRPNGGEIKTTPIAV